MPLPLPRSSRLGAAKPKWLSGHLFYTGESLTEAADRIIVGILDSFVQQALTAGWIEDCFYVRYGEGGPHLRCRFRGDSSVLDTVVAPAFAAHLENTLPLQSHGTPGEAAFAGGTPSRFAPLMWIPYEPEVDRYGGMPGVRLAEQFFHASSQVSTILIRRTLGPDRANRLGMGLATMVALLKAFSDGVNDAVRLGELHRDQFGGVWRPDGRGRWKDVFDDRYERTASQLSGQVATVWDSIQMGSRLPPPLDIYHDACKELYKRLLELSKTNSLVFEQTVPVGWRAAVQALVPSYMHMTSNRLGILPSEEGYLSHVIARSLMERST
jgi:thiopeptide-type bacteriocin biosynthesis protein